MRLTNSEDSIREASSSIKHQHSILDKVFLIFIFLIPFIPRPTIEHPAKFLAPVLILGLLYIYVALLFIKGKASFPKYKAFGLLTSLLFFISLIYTLRILINQEGEELPYLISRFLSFFCIIGFLSWMMVKQISIKIIYKSLFYGFIILSLLIIFIGLTGYKGLGDLRPPRTFGFTLPFYKTTAIPRSYGEFGIIASAVWAYFLIYKSSFKKPFRVLYGIVLILSIVISQSRSTYFSIALVTISFLFLKIKETKRLVPTFLIIAIVLPLIMVLLLPFIRDIPVINVFIGEGIYEKNIYVRFQISRIALSLIAQEPQKLFWGISHLEWSDFYYGMFSIRVGIHNHFLSNIIFLGVIGGFFNLLIFIFPLVKFLKMKVYEEKDNALMILVAIGFLSCLHFYEGFFSIITALNLSSLWYLYIKRDKNAAK